MSPETADRLAEINRVFYEDQARAFSDTRSPSGAELEWIIPWIPAGARVLDLGCGNGRAAVLLVAREFRGVYAGIDGSPALVRTARESAGALGLGAVSFLQADLRSEDIPALLAREGIPGSFDVVMLLAVLHHIPGASGRERGVRQAAQLLAPTGRLLVSTWQFLDHPRMRRKVLPWSVAGIDEAEVEAGDALLSWKGDDGYRFCHWIGEAELGELARRAGLRIVSTARAGGREATLSLCAVLER